MNKLIKLRMPRGDMPGWPFQVKDGADNPQSLQGAAVVFTARERRGDATAVFTKSIGSGITMVDAPTGRILVRPLEADTANLTVPKTLVWDIQVTDALGNKETVAEGELLIRQDVSRP